MTKNTRSTSASTCDTVRFIERLSALRWRVWKPGVSTNTNCAPASVRMPVTRWRVVCALLETMLIFCPTQAVEQRRLADVGAADDGDEAAARRAAVCCVLVRRRAVTCPVASARSVPAPARTAHSTSKVLLMGLALRVATMR
jgi:hypothetical protein